MIVSDGSASSGAHEEWARIAALRRLGVIDQPAEPILDHLVALIAKLLDVPIALISLVDETRQQFYARTGLDQAETPREIAFCDYTIRRGETMIVPDALDDERFRDNPLVTGEPNIRFYAGAPLRVREGYAIGSLCVIDRRPRTLSASQIAVLEQLAGFVVEFFDARVRFIEADAVRGHLASILAASPLPIISFDRDGRVANWNAAAERLFGYSEAEVIDALPPTVPPENVPAFLDLVRRVFAGERFADVPVRRIARDGRRLNVSVSAAPVVKSDGSVVSAMCILRDVTETRRREESDRRRFEILELVADAAPLEDIFRRTIDCVEFGLEGSVGSIMLAAGSHLRIASSGAGLSAFLRHITDDIPIGPNEGSCGTAALERAPVFAEDVSTDARWRKYRDVAHLGGIRACWSVPVSSADGDVLGTIAAYFQKTAAPTEDQARFLSECAHLLSIAIESDRSRRRLETAALSDALTGLPNRTAFEERLRRELGRARENGTKAAICLVDLDGFKEVNDRYGHAVGDLLLREVAHRLESVARAEDMVARVGGDEFMLCLGGLTDRSGLEAAVERFSSVLDAAFRPAGRTVEVAGSIGVALFPDDASEPSQLYRLADRAMYAAKSAKTGVTFHAAEAESAPRHHRGLAIELADAIENGGLVLHFQPTVSLADGSVVGAEALVRWNHPTRGLLMPGDFLEVAEETGLCIPVGSWVLHEAARAQRRLAGLGFPIAVSANVSPRQFEDPDFVETVTRAIAAAGVAPGRLYLEITENLIMRSPLASAKTLKRLAQAGARVLIDDYGTGYSSLSYLRGVIIAGIKIHASFVRDIDAPEPHVLVRGMAAGMVGFTRTLGIEAVAEGIETREQFRALAAANCTSGQGFFFARPMPLEQLEVWRAPAGFATFGAGGAF